MNCPSCNRILASTLSVCPSCGTMVHDSVREELALKISPIVKPIVQLSEDKPIVQPTENKPIVQVPPANPPVPKSPPTMEIMSKATSPTLVDFQNKNATLPDWRLQLQNSVRKRIDNQNSDDSVSPIIQSAPRRVNLPTNGATALKAETIEEIAPIPPANPTVKNALKRIEESRRKYLMNEVPPPPVEQTTVTPFPLVLPIKPQEFLPKQSESENVSGFAKPNIVPFSNQVKVEKFDTNKLPPLPPPAKISSSFEKRPVEPKKILFEIIDDDLPEMPVTNSAEVMAYGETNVDEKIIDAVENTEENEEIDDCAPISLRFNAALFDLLICSFLSLILLSPFMLLNGRFFSIEGFFAFLATCSIVLFIYLTTTVGFLGRTFGMRIFSLEIVDVEENDYPTLHQAAVSSSVYLLSLAFGGAGFLTMLLNSEKRAAHDLLSGTIIVKEE